MTLSMCVCGAALVGGLADMRAAQAQGAMDMQRLVWRCGYDARERGLSGQAAEDFTNRCIDAAAPAKGAKKTESKKGATKWRFSRSSAVQVDLVVRTERPGFALALTCMTGQGSAKAVTSFLSTPRDWRPAERDLVKVDGALLPIEADGSEGGVSLSDTVVNNQTALSAKTISAMMAGSTLVVAGSRAGRPANASFQIGGGAEPFARFKAACGANWPE